MFIGWCLLFVVCCLLVGDVVGSLSSGVRVLLVISVRCLLLGVRCLVHAVCCLICDGCHVLFGGR